MTKELEGAPETWSVDVRPIDDKAFERLRQNFTSNFFHNGPNMTAPDMSSMLVQIRDENIRLKKAADISDKRIAELEAHCRRLGQGGGERYWEARWRDTNAELATARNEALEEAAIRLDGILAHDKAELIRALKTGSTT